MVQHHPLHHGSDAKLESKHQRGDISGDRWKKRQFVKRIVLKAEKSDLDLGKMCDTDEIRFPLQVQQRVEKQVLPTMQKKLAVTAAKGWLSERFGCKLLCLGMFEVVWITGAKMVMNALLTWSSNRLYIANPEWKIIFCSYLHLPKTLMATARIRDWVGRQVYNILELLLLGSKVFLDQLSSDSVSCWICDPRRPLCEQAVGPTLTFALEDGMNLTLTAKVSWHQLAVVSLFCCVFSSMYYPP